jgi:hypothetical protein
VAKLLLWQSVDTVVTPLVLGNDRFYLPKNSFLEFKTFCGNPPPPTSPSLLYQVPVGNLTHTKFQANSDNYKIKMNPDISVQRSPIHRHETQDAKATQHAERANAVIAASKLLEEAQDMAEQANKVSQRAQCIV